MFAVSTLEGKNHKGDELWKSTPIDHSTAQMILIHNGWTKEQADEALAECPDKWILVNNTTQIC